FFAEDERFPKDYDVFWSLGGTMFTAAGATAEPIVPRGTSVIHTSLDTSEVGRTYPVDVPMTARVDLTARAVLEELRTRTLSAGAIADRRHAVQRYTSARRQTLDEQARRVWNDKPIAVERLASELNRLMDPTAI